MNDESISYATVTIKNLGGRGVLIPGQMVLTAAHCVDWRTDDGRIFMDEAVEEIETCDGDRIRVAIAALDAVADLAVLRAVDDQSDSEHWELFQKFCDNTSPVPLSMKQLDLHSRIKARILSHTGQWINCEGQAFNDHSIFLVAEDRIRGGTSGSPIINERGELLGVVSHAIDLIPETAGAGEIEDSDDHLGPVTGGSEGPTAYASRSLPVWMIDLIAEAQR